MHRKGHTVVKEVPGWRNLSFTKRARSVGNGEVLVPRAAVDSEMLELARVGDLAISIKHTIEVGDVDGGGKSKIVTEFHGPIREYYWYSAQERFRFLFHDNLIYLRDKVVNADGVADVDPGNVTCVEYCRSLINSELLSPTDGTRAIDIPAQLGGLTAGGSVVDLPTRWTNLADMVERALVDGSCFIEAPLIHNAGTPVVEFRISQVIDQTAGSGNTVSPLSEDLTGSDVVVRVNLNPIRNRFYMLGTGTGAARNVRSVDATVQTGGIREQVEDARHLTTDAELDALGAVLAAQSAEGEVEAKITNVDRTMNITPGMRVTLVSRMASDADTPDFGPLELNVMAKTIRTEPTGTDEISLEVGHEPLTPFKRLNQLSTKSDQAAFE